MAWLWVAREGGRSSSSHTKAVLQRTRGRLYAVFDVGHPDRASHPIDAYRLYCRDRGQKEGDGRHDDSLSDLWRVNCVEVAVLGRALARERLPAAIPDPSSFQFNRDCSWRSDCPGEQIGHGASLVK